MEKRELALDIGAAHEREALHRFERARGLANFAARRAKPREAIGARARRGFGGLKEGTGQSAPQSIDERCVPARHALRELLAEHQRLQRHVVSVEPMVVEHVAARGIGRRIELRVVSFMIPPKLAQ
jgi:hypothetical protein